MNQADYGEALHTFFSFFFFAARQRRPTGSGALKYLFSLTQQ